MITTAFVLQTKSIIALFVITVCSTLYGGIEPSHMLGDGEPDLKIVYKTPNRFVVLIDELWTIGLGLIGRY